MKLERGQRVTMDEAKRSALLCLAKHRFALLNAASIAVAIWPHNNMKAQGAGAAASRILRKMMDENLVVWTTNRGNWGYELTAEGRAAARSLSLDPLKAVQ